MSTNLLNLVRIVTVAVALLSMTGVAVAQGPGPQHPSSGQAALGTAFTYQGQLKLSGNPVTGACDLRFILYDAQIGGSQVGPIQDKAGVSLTSGLFTIPDLDFGASAFTGDARWLEIAVRCPTGSGNYVPLAPRQALTPAPYALYAPSAGSIPWSGLTGLNCSSGQLPKWNGIAWACGDDLGGTTYSAGSGLVLAGTVFSADTTYLQRRVSNSCTAGSSIRAIAEDGSVTCQDDTNSGGDITGVTAGAGLTGGGTSGNVTLAANFGGTGAATTIARSDHNHWGQVWTGSSGGLELRSTDWEAISGRSYNSTQGVGLKGYVGSSNQDFTMGTPSAVAGWNSVPSGRAYGVYGASSSTSGYGVYGAADASTGTNYGVYGRSGSASGIGVKGVLVSGVPSGLGSFLPPAVWGDTNSGNGVMGTSSREGGAAVVGQSTGSGMTAGVRGSVTSASGFAGWFDTTAGNGVYISTPGGKIGLNVAGGSKNAVVSTNDGSRLLYTEESTQVWFTDYGFGKLKDGMAVVSIDPVFAQTVDLKQPYHVFAQVYGDADVYVSNRTPEQFEVHLRGTGDSSVEFSYRIVALRLGYAGTRMQRAPWADNDPNLYPGKGDLAPQPGMLPPGSASVPPEPAHQGR